MSASLIFLLDRFLEVLSLGILTSKGFWAILQKVRLSFLQTESPHMHPISNVWVIETLHSLQYCVLFKKFFYDWISCWIICWRLKRVCYYIQCLLPFSDSFPEKDEESEQVSRKSSLLSAFSDAPSSCCQETLEMVHVLLHSLPLRKLVSMIWWCLSSHSGW